MARPAPHLTVEKAAPEIQGAPSIIELPAALDLTAAADLRDRLIGFLDDGRPVRLDDQAIRTVSTPCLQVLMAAARAFEGAGLSFEMSVENAALVAAISDLGLEPSHFQGVTQ